MVIGNAEAVAAATDGGGANNLAHPSGIPQDKIDNIMSGIANTGDVKLNNHRKKLRQRFDIIKKLGQGTYGKVQLGINKETGQEVAIKTIKKCKIEAEADLVRIRREVQIMSSVQHPNIIHIYEVFENREKMVLVMEFAAGGELYDYLSERKVLCEEEARRIFRQVATAVYYCHKHKICHRDLKLENILLDEQGNAKIADFGLSNVFDDQRLLATFCGSPLYASPEIVEGTPYQGPEVDCWSLGVLLYTLVYGSMPFDGSNFKRLVKQISQGDYYEPKKPSRASSLIRDMLTVCPRKRATIEQICAHWWVNENDNMSCLDLAENLANQTPVRLDVLLSLTPIAVTADQLVVPSAADSGAGAGKGNDRVPRSHSVGSIRDIGGANTEAERRILDMVAAGGEAALMPSPTRTITPAQSPVQTKRKLEPTVSMENAMGTTAKKKEKAANNSFIIAEKTTMPTEESPMESSDVTVEDTQQTPAAVPTKITTAPSFSQKDMEMVGDLCEQLIQDNGADPEVSIEALTVSPTNKTTSPESATTKTTPSAQRQKTGGKLDAVVESPEEKDAAKVIKKFVNKHKTADLVNAINAQNTEKPNETQSVSLPSKKPIVTANSTPEAPPAFVRKCSLQDESTLNKFNNERRKSRILETAEKFQQMNAAAGAVEKPKKLVIPGVSVGSFKKEFERKTSTTSPAQGPTIGERRAMEQVAAAAAAAQENESDVTPPSPSANMVTPTASALEASDSKSSVASLTLDDARRSMENSIALLRQAQNESSKEVDQLCAKTESIGMNEPISPATSTRDQFAAAERERKLENARAIIRNAILPVIRRPPPLHGIGSGGGYGQMRATSGSFIGSLACSPYALYQEPMTQSAPAAPTIQAPQFSKFALAAAKKTLQDRLFSGGVPSQQLVQQQQQQQEQKSAHNINNHHQNNDHKFCHPNSLPTPVNPSPFKIYQQQQKYQAANQIRANQDHQQSNHHQAHINSFPTPLNAANASTSVAINVNSFNNTRNNSAYPSAMWLKSSPGGDPNAPGTVKTSTASITLKSATLPRRKANAKTEIQLDIKPRTIVEQQPTMHFTTEMQHPVADLRSAPPREGPVPYSPIKTILTARATSLEPKEHIITIQRPPAYTRTTSNTTTRSGSLSRQSTVESESDTATNVSQSTITGSSQPIKKSPREFIIPIAVEGGGFITPREGSIEPSESSHTTASSRSTFSRLRPMRRIGSLLSDAGVEESSPFQKMRTASINRDGDDEARFSLHRLRSSRPVKKISQDNDSQSSGEEDDDDGFEILTAENLFSTLLQRVRALTNRLDVNHDLTAGFPNSSRLLSNMKQSQSPFWNQQIPFGSRLNNASNSSALGAPWRHSMSRDLDSEMESMFSRTGATLPRVVGTNFTPTKHVLTINNSRSNSAFNPTTTTTKTTTTIKTTTPTKTTTIKTIIIPTTIDANAKTLPINKLIIAALPATTATTTTKTVRNNTKLRNTDL